MDLVKLDRLENYLFINLKNTFPDIFGFCTIASLSIHGSIAILNLDLNKLPKNFMTTGILFNIPLELKPYLPKNMIFSLLSNSSGLTMIVWLEPNLYKIGSYSHTSGTNYPNQSYYGQICWIL